jgi:hypothetical protein
MHFSLSWSKSHDHVIAEPKTSAPVIPRPTTGHIPSSLTVEWFTFWCSQAQFAVCWPAMLTAISLHVTLISKLWLAEGPFSIHVDEPCQSTCSWSESTFDLFLWGCITENCHAMEDHDCKIWSAESWQLQQTFRANLDKWLISEMLLNIAASYKTRLLAVLVKKHVELCDSPAAVRQLF